MKIKIRKAKIHDAKSIYMLLNHFAGKKELLPRSLAEVYENLQQFAVAQYNKKIIGCCALYICWDNLAEIKGLAVDEKIQGKGIGRKLLTFCLNQARLLGITRIFTLTIRTDFFKKFGFRELTKDKLPQKVWNECVRCPYFPQDCIENAMILELKKTKIKKLEFKEFPQAFIVPSEPKK